MLDAKNGFWQVKPDEESSYFTTFNTPYRRFRWLRMPFGIAQASEENQRHIHGSHKGLNGVEDVADDILCVCKGDTL